MYIEKEVCLIVDAFATGKKIPKYLSGLGYQCVHVQSGYFPEEFKFEKRDFIKTIVFNGDIEILFQELNDFSIKMCMPGSESGIELSDLISEILGLPTNGVALSKARLNKYLMIEEVAKARLATVKHFKSESEDRVLEWVKVESGFPVVLKPVDSANGHLVFFCNTEAQLRIASREILASKNIFGKKNNEVLVESINLGQEYIVNVVSSAGKHFPVEVWKVTRIDATTIYDFVEIVGSSEKVFDILVNYTSEVLTSLGVQYGPSITELKYNEAKGPVLIESTPRVMGGALLSVSHNLYGFNQVTLGVDAYLDSRGFKARLKVGAQPPKYYAMAVMLISDLEGMIIVDPDISAFKKLESFYGLMFNFKKGDFLKKTINSLSSPGEIYLVAVSKDILRKDYLKIREIEKLYLYKQAIQPQKIHDTSKLLEDTQV